MRKPLAVLALCMPVLMAQVRISGSIDDRDRVRLYGTRHPLAIQAFDAGAVAPEVVLNGMILVLTPDPVQQQELDTLNESQHDPASPDYQHWLTPEEFGARFGASNGDLAAVRDWLERHGFRVDEIPAGRRIILFSGTAGQVESAFHIPMRRYRVNGRTHIANAGDIEIPRALAGLVAGISTLHDFGRQPLNTGAIQPSMNSSTGAHYLAPTDFSVIYNVNPLYQAGVDGSGQTIAVVGRTNINIADVTKFRSAMALPPNDPIVVLNGPDPGIWDQGELTEALLDTEWAGAVARKATVKLVVSKNTSTTDGVDLSAQYIVNSNLASIMTISFGACEAFLGSAENLFWKNLFQQAAAQGITAFVSAGDSGAAGCDGAGATQATHGRAVNGLASTPFNVAVGGTQFNDTNPSLYWSTNSIATGFLSALGYIPEKVWNESGSAGGNGLWSTGGGASIVYAKPSWQTGPGVPADGARDIPDISLSAAGHVAYLVVQNGGLYAVGGTSAASPAFASLMALVNQQAGARQGNANTSFYKLGAQQASGGAAIFHDISTGNNNVPGVTGFAAGTGFDQATGWGSVDAYQMVTRWTNTQSQPDFRLTIPNSAQVQAGKTVQVSISTTLTNGFNSGISFSAANLPAGLTAAFAPANLPPPGSGASILTFTAAATAVTGAYNVTVTAAGSGATRQATITVTITSAATLKLAPSTTALRVTAAAPAQSTVAVTVGGAFNSAVTLTASGLPAGVSAVYSPSSLNAPGGGVSTLTISATTSAAAGDYQVTLTAAGGSLTATATITVTVSRGTDLGLAADTYNLSVSQNGSTSTHVTTAALNGFNSAVSFVATGMPSGLSATFAPSTLPAPGAGSSTLTFTAAANTTPGVYAVSVIASGGGVSRTIKVTVTVTVPSAFTLTASTNSLNVMQAGAATLNATVSITGAFNAPVTFGTAPLPTGITATFSPASLPAPGSGSSTITITAAATISTGPRTIFVNATSGGVTKTAVITVNVTAPPLLVVPAATAVVVNRGGWIPLPLTVKIANAPAAAVTLSATGLPSGVTATFSANKFTAAGTWSSSITFAAATAASTGSWTINLVASDGVNITSTPIKVTVQ